MLVEKEYLTVLLVIYPELHTLRFALETVFGRFFVPKYDSSRLLSFAAEMLRS